MALFHDPLDELIAGLERSVPAAEPADVEYRYDFPPLVDIQVVIGIILKGSPEERESLDREPRYIRVVEHFRKFQGYRGKSSAPTSSDRTS